MSFQSYYNAEYRALQKLNLNSDPFDPSVDRVLEGAAHLAARIHERLDHDFPEIPAQLLHHHWPALLQPYASRVMVQFSSAQMITLPKDTVIRSDSVGEENVSCTFLTVSDITVYPLELINVAFDKNDKNNKKLLFYFKSHQRQLKLSSLKLYLKMDITSAMEFLYAADQVIISSESSIQLWLDYFGFREQFLFLILNNISYSHDNYYVGELRLKQALSSDVEITVDNFALNCAAAINCYRCHAEPITVELHRSEYVLCPDNHYPESILLHSIKTINTDYQWDYARARLLLNNVKAGQVISSEVNVTNGYYPQHYLRKGMIKDMASGNQCVTVKNITLPSSYLLPLAHKNYYWELISVLSWNFKKLDLEKILQLLNWSSHKNFAKQVESILQVDQKPIYDIRKGMVYQGREFNLRLKEENFGSVAEVYLFGGIAHHFFKLTSEQNNIVKTHIELYPSGRILSWNYP